MGQLDDAERVAVDSPEEWGAWLAANQGRTEGAGPRIPTGRCCGAHPVARAVGGRRSTSG